MKRILIVLLLICVLLIQGQVLAQLAIPQDVAVSSMTDDGCGDDGGDPAPEDEGGGGNE